MERPSGLRTCLYDAIQLDAVMENMARQAAGLLAGKGLIVVVGILRRGAPLADRLAELLVKRFGLPAPLRLDLSVKRYADDLTLLYPETRLTEEAAHEALDLEGYTVLLVDDVLYTGHSLLKVVGYLARKKSVLKYSVCRCPRPVWRPGTLVADHPPKHPNQKPERKKGLQPQADNRPQ